MSTAWLALGGNVGDSRAVLDRAVSQLCDGQTIRLLARSSDYRTPTWGVTEQAPFINLCIAVDTGLTPGRLLARTHEVERALGRDRAREQRWGPRTADIDIIAYDDISLHDDDLILPHPRVLERAFVLVPLAEIAPQLMVKGTRISDALARLKSASKGVVPLPDDPART